MNQHVLVRFKTSNLKRLGCQGMGLLEVLVALGISGILAAVVMSMFKLQMNMGNSVSARFSAEGIRSQIAVLLEIPTNCSASFRNLPTDSPQEVNQILNSGGVTVFSTEAVAPNLEYDGLKITKLELRDFQYDDPADTTNLNGKLQLHIGLRALKEVAGSTEILRTVPLFVTVKTRDSSSPDFGLIGSCSGKTDIATNLLVSCVSGTYLTGYDADGNPLCKNLPACPTGEFLQGFDTDGNPICQRISFADLNFSAMSCPTDQYMTGIDSTGAPICELVGSGAVTTTPPVTCSSPAGSAGQTRTGSCPSGQTGSITYTCNPPNWIATGNTCTSLPPCRQDFYNPKVTCGGVSRYVRQPFAMAYCQYMGFSSGTKIVEGRSGPAVCDWNGSTWVTFDSGSNGILGQVRCTRTSNCQ